MIYLPITPGLCFLGTKMVCFILALNGRKTSIYLFLSNKQYGDSFLKCCLVPFSKIKNDTPTYKGGEKINCDNFFSLVMHLKIISFFFLEILFIYS